jgi:epoxyqueuosine reductase QueG
MLLEEEGYSALPQRRHQQIMAEENSTNPEVAFDAIYRGRPQETQMDFSEAAVLCGLGEIGLHGALLTDEFGPFVRTCFVLTDAELEATPVKEPHLCDKCGECVKGCPGHAISEDGSVDAWQCAVYYNGANGLKNPFMPPDAFRNFEDRVAIISGEAKVTPETARKILQNIYFYPPAQHAYQCSICGRACDVSCYIHLEKKGVLTKTFKSPFRKREEWRFDIEDYQI